MFRLGRKPMRVEREKERERQRERRRERANHVVQTGTRPMRVSTQRECV